MTPAIDLLNQHSIDYKIHQYKHTPGVESYGDEAARELGVDPQQLFKTLITEAKLSSGSILVVGIVPVSLSLNLKSLAKAVGAKNAVMADKKKAQLSSGYILGGVSPLAQKRPFKTVIDISANKFSSIFVSAGKRGLDVELAPDDLAKLTNASFADIATAQANSFSLS